MRRSTFILSFFSCCALQAQVLRVEPGTDDPMTLRFNEAFIQRNGIVAIEGQGNVKRDGEPIRQKNERAEYRFDAAGRMTQSSTSYGRNSTVMDTSFLTCVYDPQGRLLEQQRNDRSGRFAQGFWGGQSEPGAALD